jgi:hypothetical protein
VSPFRGALTLSRLSRYLCLGRVSVSFSRYLTVLTVGLRSLPNQALTVINLRGVLVWHLTPHLTPGASGGRSGVLLVDFVGTVDAVEDGAHLVSFDGPDGGTIPPRSMVQPAVVECLEERVAESNLPGCD